MTPLDAFYRMQRAWEASQPQLVFDNFWPDSGLDETHVPAHPHGAPGAEAAVRLVEPARIPSHRRGQGGLTDGAEPSWDLLRTDGVLSSSFPAPPVSPPRSGGSAPPINTTGPGALPAEEKRPAQRRSL